MFLIWIITFVINILYSQTKGRALYGVSINDSFAEYIERDQRTDSNSILKKIGRESENLTLELIFSDSLSLFQLVNSLSIDDTNKIFYTAAKRFVCNGQYYQNTKEMKLYHVTQYQGENIIVFSDIKDAEWELLNESRVIMGYVCYKAKGKSFHKKSGVETPYEIEAWYSPSFQINKGLKDYKGLPGLIVELTDLKFRYYLKELHLNKNDEILIDYKNKGKVLSQGEFDLINKGLIEKYKQLKYN